MTRLSAEENMKPTPTRPCLLKQSCCKQLLMVVRSSSVTVSLVTFTTVHNALDDGCGHALTRELIN